MDRDPKRYGRSEEEWGELLVQTSAFLKEQARLRRVTSYSEVNWAVARRSGLKEFDFAVDRDRDAMGALLADVTEEAIDEYGGMLSALVVYIDRNDAGPGFYKFGERLGLLAPGSDADQKLAFWSGQVEKAHAHYARPRRERSR